MSRKLLFTILFISLLFVCLNGFSANYYVNVNSGSDKKSGLTERNSWKTITHALSQVESNEQEPAIINIASGEYNPATGEEFPLEMKDYVVLAGDDMAGVIIDASKTNMVIRFGYNAKNPDDSYGIAGGNINNVTIKNGSTLNGGGIYCYLSSPEIENCFFEYNTAHNGGGIYCEMAHSIKIINCIFNGNNSNDKGGAIYFSSCNQPIIENDDFTNNKANKGSGIYLYISSPDVTFCNFERNHAYEIGGGLFCNKSTPNCNDCLFFENEASKGGGLYFYEKVSNQASFKNCRIMKNLAQEGGGIYCNNSSPKFLNCLFANNNYTEKNLNKINQTYTRGGGIFSKESSPRFSNCTIADNLASEFAGLFAEGSKFPTLINCIGWGNGYSPMTIKTGVTFSDIEGENIFPGIGNINDNPLFVNGPQGGYYLSQTAAENEADSPCIDKGNDSAENLGLDTMTTRTDGVPDSSIVDMGYHYTSQLEIVFELSVSNADVSYTAGDKFKLILNLRTGVVKSFSDIYLVMLNPENQFYSAFEWNTGIIPFLQGVELPDELSYEDLTLLDINLPFDKPPIKMLGIYTFAIAAFKTNTEEFLSNLSVIYFQYK